MGDSSLFVSNGTCYTSAGKELDKQFIPCGNDAFGHQTCCGAGDNCLADNACFGVHGSGYGSMLTYFGGCTDPDYKDKTCPDKKGIDQPWIALTLCDNGDGVWGACSQEGNPSTLQPGSYCSCTDASAFTPVAFSDSTVLASLASLPTGTGGSIAFAAGHAPTSPPADATTEPSESQSNSGAASSGGTPTETGSNAASRTGSGSNASATGSNGSATGSNGSATGSNGSATGSRASSASSTASGSTDPSSSNPSTSKSSSGKAIGIGVGVGVAAILLIAIAAFFLIRRRRRRRQPRGTQPITASELEKKDPLPVDPAKPAQPRMSGVESTTVSEADGRPISKGDHPGTSELAGASVLEADGKGVSKAARPGTFELDSSNVVEADGHTARPWNMGSEMGGGQGVGGHHDVGHGVVRPDGHLSPVAELPGSGIPRRDYAPPGVRTRD